LRLLLDSHVYLWYLQRGVELTPKLEMRIADADEVFVSSASIWELAIKVSVGKLKLDMRKLVASIPSSGFRELPVLARHAALVAALPLHHRDPFDRLLIAQAICEPLRLITADARLSRYSELVDLVV
jgi:PIN domain nuclease of toxin-antitoxin system